MKLVGRMLPPFVRRVAATLNLYGTAWESLPLSTVTDGEKIRAINPVGRVPALILDSGEVLLDSAAILDFLDEGQGDAALTPRAGAERREVLRLVALGLGAAEKSVAAYYETARRPEPHRWPENAEGLLAQARGAFMALESALGDRGYLALGRVTQADVTAVVALDFADTVLPRLAENLVPRLSALRHRLNDDPRIGGTRFVA